MTIWTLIKRSFQFHARAHFGVCLGAAIGSAALVGALVVGDSVRESLRQQALSRIGNSWFALAPSDRLFTSALAQQSPASSSAKRIAHCGPTATLLRLPGIGSVPGGDARANQVQVFGVVNDSWNFLSLGPTNLPPGTVWLNQILADQLGVRPGDRILLRVSQSELLSADSPVAPRDQQTVALNLRIGNVLGAESGGDLNLQSSGLPPRNAFVRAEELWEIPNLKDKANLLLVGQLYQSNQTAKTEQSIALLNDTLRQSWTLEDTGLKLDQAPGNMGIELRSSRVFLEPPIVVAAAKFAPTNSISILTYLANLMVAGTNSTPYSMVAAVGPPYTPTAMLDDEVIINQWLAEDLGAKPGDTLSMTYFAPESGSKLLEHTNLFRIHSVVPMDLPWADRTLMPDFPGIEKADNPREWNAGFPLVHKIRPQDEDYWKNHRGTPKAFVTLAAGQKLWANRFGTVTAVRFPNSNSTNSEVHLQRFADQFLSSITPAELGFQFEPVRAQALQAANQSQDFGGLFLGFSIFLVVSALLLMGLLFQFSLEQRSSEIGTLLALGFTAPQVRRLLMFEGMMLALSGGVIGVLAGLVYARAMLLGLMTIWRSAIGSSSLQYHSTVTSLIIGFGASILVCCLTIWLTLRKQARQPAHELLEGIIRTGQSKGTKRSLWLAWSAGLLAVLLVLGALFKQETANAGIFFGAGSLLLISGLASTSVWLTLLDKQISSNQLTLKGLGVRNCARRRKRSLTTMALLASGCFVISAISAFQLDAARDAHRPSSGTGGFALLGQSALPIAYDLNTQSGREALGLSADDLAQVNVVPMRVREGDEASCLNLSRAQKPRVLGVNPALLKNRFTFAKVHAVKNIRDQWNLLRRTGATSTDDGTIPAIGDANSIQWALGKKLGETLDYTDEQGRPFKLRLVGAVANSILQGSLLIDEAEFVQRFPGQSGHQMFLIDSPPDKISEVSRTLTRALQDQGLELTSTIDRLNAFNAVQNTYLGTFQILGGLGLLLGSAGLGVVVLRNVLERRGELGVLLAIGFRRRSLKKLILTEHGALLGLGLGIGIVAATVAVLPTLISAASHLPYGSLAITLSAVLLNGAAWTWIAIHWAVRGDLLKNLRNE
jgi:putative ABC transport system permease protein